MSTSLSPDSPVRIWQEPVVLPTYPAMPPDLNPMFFEKRVYQGSSGRVYPLPFTDRVSHEKRDQRYIDVHLENAFVQMLILPEIGGRIHTAMDRTNNYDFIYRNRVIKPRLVGLCGPWISGGIEFNWPQHHRPTTFSPVDYRLIENPDGSCTAWVGEHEPLNRTRGVAGITLRPGSSCIEVQGRLFNRTPVPQTFLWWANPAVRVHDNYQSFFPDDVDFVADHAKRDMCLFPVARGTYYLIDYSRGVDISWYRNIPVPTSYMVVRSAYDFFGGYDHDRQAGIIHIASHHIAPGKKQWTWGNCDFGYAWDRNLTDEDGPYIELMAGVYTDNQPDFSWLAPYETRTFKQYWYPYRAIGPAKMANLDAAVNLEVKGKSARIGLHTTSTRTGLTLLLKSGANTLFERRLDCAPDQPFVAEVPLPTRTLAHHLELSACTADGRPLITYRPRKPAPVRLPAPAKAAPEPQAISEIEQLYLTGLHLEQYRHATYDPDPYYLEALKRDPADARCNNAMGLLLLRRGDFAGAERHFRAAIATLTCRNPNPRDAEPFYNLGVILQQQERLDEAYDAFYKATWNYAWRAPAYFHLALIDGRRSDLRSAIEHLEQSLETNAPNTKARALRAACLRHLGRIDEAAEAAAEAARLDPIDLLAHCELALSTASPGARAEFQRLIRNQAESYLDLALDYQSAGFLQDAASLLEQHVTASTGPVSPMIHYHLADLAGRLGRAQDQRQHLRDAAAAPSDYCFPSRLESIPVLRAAIALNPKDAKAPYYLGNLLYDKRQYAEAIALWERSRRLDGGFSIVHRNLALAYHNHQHGLDKARRSLARALAVNPADARLLFELDQLEKRANVEPLKRLRRLERHPSLVDLRDDLTIEKCALLNLVGRHGEAIDLLKSRQFSPWEGGEGKVTEQWVLSHILRACRAIEQEQLHAAIADLEASMAYPKTLGEGKLPYTSDTFANYLLGLVHRRLGDRTRATSAFRAAAEQPILLGEGSAFQAMAQQALRRSAGARRLLEQLLAAGKDRVRAPAKIDYFAISLPNMLLFDDNLAMRNEIAGRFLIALAQMGMGKRTAARRDLQRVLALENSHLPALSILAFLRI